MTTATTDPRVAGWADKVMASIKADQEGGYVPRWVFTFAQLHDFTDANMYVIDAIHDDFPAQPDHYGDEYADGSKLSEEDQAAVDAEHDAAEAVMDAVDYRLRMARPAGWCRTCGSEVGPWDACGCWCMVAQALQQYLGADFDGSAQQAHDMWDGEADKGYVWSGEYAADHFGDGVKLYDPPAELAALQHSDALAYPHDDPCPRCGRRMWGEEFGGRDPYETCQNCGWQL